VAENTLPSFEEAIRIGVPATECDVRLSLDGEIFVMHDAKLDRTTSLGGWLAATPAATLAEAGVPRFCELVRLVENRIVLVVEIKSGEGIEAKVVSHLEKRGLLAQTIVFSFDSERVARAKRASADVFGVWLLGRPVEPWLFPDLFGRLEAVGAEGFGIGHKNVTPELVAAARERQIPVFAWTVPPGEDVERLRALGVNFIITDHPRDVLAQLG
jgi:glycerophosphoryl diester phosphodiesterase